MSFFGEPFEEDVELPVLAGFLLESGPLESGPLESGPFEPDPSEPEVALVPSPPSAAVSLAGFDVSFAPSAVLAWSAVGLDVGFARLSVA